MPDIKMPRFKITDFDKKKTKQKKKLKKVFNKDGEIIWYIKKDQIIALDYRIVANILRDEKSNITRLDFLNGTFGVLYKNGNLFDHLGNYLGTIEEKKGLKFLVLFLTLMVLLLIILLVF